jgi:hypothetical protein
VRDDIVKYLGTVLNSTAKTIADKIGVDRVFVCTELNAMCKDGVLCREKRHGAGNEYFYSLPRTNAERAVEREINTLLPLPMLPSESAKTDMNVEETLRDEVGQLMSVASQLNDKLAAAEDARDRLQAEVMDLKITASNRQTKITVLEASCSKLEAVIKENASALADRYNAQCEQFDTLQASHNAMEAVNLKLRAEIETLREQIRTAHRPIGASVADALRPFLLSGQKIIWREPFRWHDDEGFMPNHYEGMSLEALADSFGYQIVVNCELAAIIQPQGEKKNDTSDAVGSTEAA